ncbi:hypothetical protein [Brucella pituitosa]|uniref:hypothetical protein n=1 Tax=Brucella pituitosa TaxID=571256 RepID=UPI003F4ABF2F
MGGVTQLTNVTLLEGAQSEAPLSVHSMSDALYGQTESYAYIAIKSHMRYSQLSHIEKQEKE